MPPVWCPSSVVRSVGGPAPRFFFVHSARGCVSMYPRPPGWPATHSSPPPQPDDRLPRLHARVLVRPRAPHTTHSSGMALFLPIRPHPLTTVPLGAVMTLHPCESLIFGEDLMLRHHLAPVLRPRACPPSAVASGAVLNVRSVAPF